MKCQSCGKKDASVKYKENINGLKQEIALCLDCAKKLGFADFSSFFSPVFVTVPNVLSTKKEICCPTCGYTLDNYSKTGMFGCPDCYNTFSDTLDEIFVKLHGKNRHVENIKSKKKIKVSHNAYEKIDELKEKIQDLIKKEEYEQAAVIRDEIKKLEGK